MNFKKIVAGIAAVATAVSMMAVSAFADTVYGGSWDEYATSIGAAQEVDASSWTELVIAEGKALRENNKDKNMLIFVTGDTSEVYVKVAGNIEGKWNDGTNGTIDAVWADSYNAETGCVTVPYSVWGKFSELQVGVEHCTLYGMAFEDDTATIDAITALMAGGAADTTEAADTTADDTAADDTAATTEDTTTAPTTGNVAVAAIASVMAVAGAAAIVSKKRN